MVSSSDDGILSREVGTVVEESRRALFNALDALEGDKTLIFERSLMRRVNLFATPTTLKTHGVTGKLCALDQPRALTTPHAVFLLSPTLKALDGFCDYIDKVKPDSKTLLQVFFVPEVWYVVREKLKERDNGRYWERIESVKALPLWWVPQDGNCLSLMEPALPSRLLLNGDWTHLYRVAVALHELISLCDGKVPIYSRGKWANDVARMVHKVKADADCSQSGALRLNRVVIIDRWIDPLTPMLTQLTYSGLLDELFDIDIMNTIKVPLCDFNESPEGDPFDTKEIYLNDELYQSFRHVHINALGVEISRVLHDIRKDQEIDSTKMSIAEYQVLVKKLPYIRKRKELAEIHTRLAEMAREQLYDNLVEQIKVQKDFLENSNGDASNHYIEDTIIQAADLITVLRLISIQSLTSGGLKPSVFANYRRLVMQSYGIAGVNKLMKMQKMGLIREKGAAARLQPDVAPMIYLHLKKQYELLVEDVRESDRSHPAYAYSGYCSLLTRILAEGDRVRWAGWEKTGEHGGGDDDRTAVLVIGGLTRSEVALIEQLPNVSLVATTSLITADRLIHNITRI